MIYIKDTREESDMSLKKTNDVLFTLCLTIKPKEKDI